jgi:hydroxymethylpyrimidine pyrophosphatase-like HAD family hydrolase
MQFCAVATDYDGTLATAGVASAAALNALERVRDSGRALVLVTGRELDELLATFSESRLFDLIVAENGAIVYEPRSGARRAVAPAPPPELVAALRARGVQPLSVGESIVATMEPNETVVLEVIRALGLDMHIVFNKGAVMVLPSAVNKAYGLRFALEALGIEPGGVVGIGDAENDHSLFAFCGYAVAVGNALDAVKARADYVSVHVNGAAVAELAEALLAHDLAEWPPARARPRETA